MPDPKDPTNPDPKDPKDPKDPATPPDPKAPPKDDDKITVPKETWDQNYKRMKDAERKAEELETANRKREEDEARAKGEHEKLANGYKAELETTKTEAERLKKEREEDDKVFEQLLAGHLAQISDENKSLIPEEFSVRQKLTYIEKNRDRLLKGAAKGEPGQPKGDDKNPSDEQSKLQVEFDALKEKATKNGGALYGADRARYMDLNRKLMEMKAAKK
jgi:hypothetical protein